MEQTDIDPDWKADDIVRCPECGNGPADARVLGETDLGAGLREQKIWCDECETIYEVILSA